MNDLQEGLRGNLVCRLRSAMDLPDNFQVPVFIFDAALHQLNQAIETSFLGMITKLLDEQRLRDNERSHQVAA